MANLMDKLSKEAPAGRGASLLTATDVKQIASARTQGYSWEQIWRALEKYNSPQAVAQAFYRETEATNNEKA